MDEAARAAFSQWKFKPALRDGKPVPVEILVGIPTEDPGSGMNITLKSRSANGVRYTNDYNRYDRRLRRFL